MLSKTSIVILGLLHSENLSAYDMLKKIDAMNMKYWFPIGNTTLYETALRLEKKHYIQGNGTDNSKVIYTLTEQGIEELRNTIRTLFLQVDFDTIWFCLATMYCNVLEPSELCNLVQQRKALLEEYRGGTSEHFEQMKQYHIPFQGTCAIERMLRILDFEMDSLLELEKNLVKEKR